MCARRRRSIRDMRRAVLFLLLALPRAAFADASVKPLGRELTPAQVTRVCAAVVPARATRPSLSRAVAAALAGDAEGLRAWRALEERRAEASTLRALAKQSGIARCPVADAFERPLHVVEAIRPKKIVVAHEVEPVVREDGMEGGVEGGVVGGVVGGVIEAAPPPPPPPRGLVVPSGALTLVKTTPVEYPEAARQAGIEGRVVVIVTIGADGEVLEETATSGPDVLRAAAVKTVKQWRYQPTLRDGVPTRVRSVVSVVYRL